MTENYRVLKQKYNDIGKQVHTLYKEQKHIRDLMEKECNHENIEKIEEDPFIIDFLGIEEEKYKCKDCYQYFTKKME